MKQANPPRVDEIDRLAKALVDSGKVPSFDAARSSLHSISLHLILGQGVESSSTLQAAVMTAVNVGSRAFQGGVFVYGISDQPCLIQWPTTTNLKYVLTELGAEACEQALPENATYIVRFGQTKQPILSKTDLQMTFNGWSSGVIPSIEHQRLPEAIECAPAGIFAGSIAVSELFQNAFFNRIAGRRITGMSLRTPEVNWLEAEPGPPIQSLPANYWLIGLGHLGQAYLWTIGLLPYQSPSKVSLFLQDTDEIKTANISTSPLTTLNMVGKNKTRACANWMESLGFHTRLVERKFGPHSKVAIDEPQLALCGVDNPEARAALEEVGFQRIIEAGLGSHHSKFLEFQIHTFPSQVKAKQRWARSNDLDVADTTPLGYMQLAEEGVDQCGLLEIAGRAVGAAFVGCAVAALVIAQAIRMVDGLPMQSVVSGSLGDLRDISSQLSTQQNFQPNLGIESAI